MHIHLLTLLTLLLSSNSVLLCSPAPADTSDTQEALDTVERIVQESEKEDDDCDDLVGITVKDTLHTAIYDGLLYGSLYYFQGALDRKNSKLKKINKKLTWCTNCTLLRPLRNFEKRIIKNLGDKCDTERDKLFLRAFKPNSYNAQLFGAMFSQYAGAILVYGGLRAATKELTGYDAMPIVQYSTENIAVQTIGHYMIPAPYNIKLFSKNQVASYVATDLTVAASMYAYKEVTGKKLACPKLPIPNLLRARGINEKLIGGAICTGIKIAMRTYVMDKLCGVPAAA